MGNGIELLILSVRRQKLPNATIWYAPIGTLDNLYYTSFQKYEKAFNEGILSPLLGNGHPREYLRPDSGFRFRFPFPDEDKLPFGEIGNFRHNRGVPVKIEPAKERDIDEQLKIISGKDFHLEITQQKLVHRKSDGKLCLALVVRNPDSGLSFSIEDEQLAKKIIKDIIRNHMVRAGNAEERRFYCKVTSCILDSYKLELPVKNSVRQAARKPQLRKHRRGLK